MTKYKKSLRMVNQIQKIRTKNNKNWMDLLKLSLKLDPKKTSKILNEIYEFDQQIANIVNLLMILLHQ